MSGPAELSDDDLVAHALGVHVLSGDDTEVYDACVAELQRRGTASIGDRALDLLADARPEARALGADVLGQFAAGTSLAPLLALAQEEVDPLVLDSVVGALGQLGDEAALPTVLAAAADGSYRVRSAAAKALPRLAGESTPTVNDPLVMALIALAVDEDQEVRNWAAFGLGSQLDVDGLAIKDVLRRLLDDADEDTRAEAMVGLARRKDPGVIPVVAAALEAEAVGRLAVAAAEFLASPALLAGLRGLAGWWDVDEELLAAATRACDPDA